MIAQAYRDWQVYEARVVHSTGGGRVCACERVSGSGALDERVTLPPGSSVLTMSAGSRRDDLSRGCLPPAYRPRKTGRTQTRTLTHWGQSRFGMGFCDGKILLVVQVLTCELQRSTEPDK